MKGARTMIFDELWRLRWKRDRSQRQYDRWIQEAEKKNNHEERESLIREAIMERDLSNDSINSQKPFSCVGKQRIWGFPSQISWTRPHGKKATTRQ